LTHWREYKLILILYNPEQYIIAIAVVDRWSESIALHKKLPDYGLKPVNWNKRLNPIPGGVPIKMDGEIVGGLGIASISPDINKLTAFKAMRGV